MKIKNYIPVILCSIALCSCSDADKNIAFGLDSLSLIHISEPTRPY